MKTQLTALIFLVATCAALPAEGYKLVLWNHHNGIANDRGTQSCKIEAFKGNSVVWKLDAVKLDWEAGEDTEATVEIPAQWFGIDRLRITILEWKGFGGGLAEVELFRGGRNLARSARVVASSFFQKDDRFSAQRAIDGITSSSQMFSGYWLLPDETEGYLDIFLKES